MALDKFDSSRLDLIDAYINNKLNSKQKLKFYEMLKADKQLQVLLAQELELHRTMQEVKVHFDDETKNRLLIAVYRKSISQADVRDEIGNFFVNLALNMTVPGPILPYINKFKRRCI